MSPIQFSSSNPNPFTYNIARIMPQSSSDTCPDAPDQELLVLSITYHTWNRRQLYRPPESCGGRFPEIVTESDTPESRNGLGSRKIAELSTILLIPVMPGNVTASVHFVTLRHKTILRGLNPQTDGKVFAWPNGRPRSVMYVSHAFKSAVVDAGVTDLHVHDSGIVRLPTDSGWRRYLHSQ